MEMTVWNIKLDKKEELATHLIETLLFHLTGKTAYYIRIDQNKDGLFKLLATSIHEFYLHWESKLFQHMARMCYPLLYVICQVYIVLQRRQILGYFCMLHTALVVDFQKI